MMMLKHTQPRLGLVLDASVIINLLGSGCAETILAAMPMRCLVVNETRKEVRVHPLERTKMGDPVAPLLDLGVLEQVSLSEHSLAMFMKLVGAPGTDALDDGEAAALAVAHDLKLTVAIDEKKGRRIAREQLPEVEVLSTVDIFALPEIAAELGDRLSDAIFSALLYARMRVHPEREAWVRLIVGEHVAQCPSLKLRP